MHKSDNKNITLFEPLPKASRVKLAIPYYMKTEREAFKKINSSYYHPQQKLWSLYNTEENMAKVEELFGDRLKKVKVVDSKPVPRIALCEADEGELDRVHKKLTLRGMSQNTIKTYRSALRLFFKYFEQQDLRTVTKEQIEGYLFELISKYKIGESTQNGIINAIKCYYEQVLGLPREYYNIARPRKSQDLPNILSTYEVEAIINSPKNIKHKAILHTIYSAGLRVGEVIRLRVQDIRRDDGYIFVKDSKGKKDRHTVLSVHLLPLLRDYYKAHKPAYWLFEGQMGGQYTATSIQRIFRKAVKETNSNPWSTPHTLRHSFATHLMQSGVSIRHIQAALGHSSSKTTEIYTRVLAINNKTFSSPLDILYENGKLPSKK